MDPLTQGVLGAIVPQFTRSKRHFLWAGVCGLVAGMAPDLDVLIRSDEDPLVYLEYHRQFTHALIFIPVGGLMCAGLLHLVLGRRFHLPFLLTYLFCTLGFATHGLLDAMTSYGTQLFWPFTNMRIAWSTISIIDPLFTIPLLILGVLCIWKSNGLYARIAVCWAALYLSFGTVQNHRAQAVGQQVAAARGHAVDHVSVKPSFGNLLVWKSIYRDGDIYYVDAVRVGMGTTVIKGVSIPALDVARDFAWLDENSQQRTDIERFRWFSNGYLAKDPTGENRITDLRYSFLPNTASPLWSIELSPTAATDAHVKFIEHEKAGAADRAILLDMIFGRE